MLIKVDDLRISLSYEKLDLDAPSIAKPVLASRYRLPTETGTTIGGVRGNIVATLDGRRAETASQL